MINDSEPPKKQTRSRRKTNYKGAENKSTSGITPRTENQKELIDAIKSSSQVLILGPAGTGKTYVTATCAADMYTLKEIDKIIITRPHVAVGKDIGFLPGTLEEKAQPWALPVLDVLIKHLGKGTVDTGLKSGNIEVATLALMRGRSFEDAFIIVDECFTGDTEVLTTQGFKRLDTVTTEDSVAQYTDEGQVQFVQPERIVDKPYSGNMVTHSTHYFSMTATENHRAIYKDAKGNLVKDKLFNAKPQTNWSVPTAAQPTPTTEATSQVILACALQADGSYESTCQSNDVQHNYWTASFKRPDKIARFQGALEALGVPYSRYEPDKRGRTRFYLKGLYSNPYLSNSKVKTFNIEAIIADGLASSFVEECLLWGGSTKGQTPVYCSTNKANIDCIQALAHMSGYTANYGVQHDKRPVFKKEPKPYYRLNITNRQRVTLQKAKQTSSFYEGRVYCVTVPSGMIVVRQNGKVFITGNCQNLTVEETKMLLTRVGEGSTIVLNGDVQQSDLKGAEGLSKVIHLAKKYMLPVPIIEFGVDDIIRSDICAQWVKVFLQERI